MKLDTFLRLYNPRSDVAQCFVSHQLLSFFLITIPIIKQKPTINYVLNRRENFSIFEDLTPYILHQGNERIRNMNMSFISYSLITISTRDRYKKKFKNNIELRLDIRIYTSLIS